MANTYEPLAEEFEAEAIPVKRREKRLSFFSFFFGFFLGFFLVFFGFFLGFFVFSLFLCVEQVEDAPKRLLLAVLAALSESCSWSCC